MIRVGGEREQSIAPSHIKNMLVILIVDKVNNAKFPHNFFFSRTQCVYMSDFHEHINLILNEKSNQKEEVNSLDIVTKILFFPEQ